MPAVSAAASHFTLSGSGSWYPRGLTLAPEWLCLWLGAEGYSSGDKQLPSYQAGSSTAAAA